MRWGVELRQRRGFRVGRDLGGWGVMFEPWAGSRRGLSLGPAQKGRGSAWKGGPLECGVPEFGGGALSEAVWAGFRSSSLEGISKCRGGALVGV